MPEEPGQYNKKGRMGDVLSQKRRYKLWNARVEKLGLAAVGRLAVAMEQIGAGSKNSACPSTRSAPGPETARGRG